MSISWTIEDLPARHRVGPLDHKSTLARKELHELGSEKFDLGSEKLNHQAVGFVSCSLQLFSEGLFKT
jgi:hypothetical protein